MTNAIKPIQDEIDLIKSQRAAGIDPANLAGASPTPNVIAPTGEGAPKAPLNFATATPRQLISAGWENMKQQFVANAAK